MDYREEIAKRIKQSMRDWEDRHPGMTLTYEKFSELTGKRLSPSRLSNYANKQRTPKPWEANIMAEALETDAAWLMCLRQELNKEELSLVRNYRALPENDRRAYFRRIEVLAMAYREPVPEPPTHTPTAPKAKPRRQRAK